ncbi:uncharacterized protein LOC124135887 [Haliotis rufescens]|uniref:uncharacterized protein LOC124135887 n=1 Tax=Haliotis rufescens TaxID=6454 RepID=UPI00201F393C|nr:uncharacterized protein LOC124135887 [Haliotis rufescens]
MELLCLFVFMLFSTVSGNNGTIDVIDLTDLVNCNDSSSILTVNQKCFDVYGVPLKMPAASMLSNLSHSPTELLKNLMSTFDPTSAAKVCSDIDSYVKASVCSSRVSRKCSLDVPFLKDMFPSADKIRKTEEYSCANVGKVNQTCLNEVLPKIVDCANITGAISISDPLSINITDLMQRTLCASTQLMMVCGRRFMPACGQLSLQMFEASQPDTSSCTSISTHVNTTGVDVVQVDCSSDQTIRKGYLQCLMNNGITLLVPEQPSSDATSQYILNAMTLDENKKLCSNLKNYQLAVNCTLWVQKQCSDHVMKPTVADSQTVQDGLAKLCGHIGDFDTKCVQNAPKAACGSKRRSLASIILRHLCDDTNATQKCLVSAVSGCSKTTVSMYKDVLLSQSPSMCLKTKIGSTSALIG